MRASEVRNQGREEELARSARSGAAASIDAWYRHEHPQVYRLCFGFLAEPAEAEDATQDAMLHLLDRLNRWDDARPYKSWRNTVVLNRCRDRLRSRASRRQAEDRAVTAQPQLRPLPSPEDSAQRREVQVILAEALQSLSEREREAFVLRDLEGVPTADVARAMDVNPASVRSLLTLARRRLRNILGPALAEPGLQPRTHGG